MIRKFGIRKLGIRKLGIRKLDIRKLGIRKLDIRKLDIRKLLNMHKLIIFTLLILCTTALSAQKRIPVVKATNKVAYIMEEKGGTKDEWWLDPAARPDVFTFKNPQKKRIYFYTDIDSINVLLGPGERFDFVVLLNGKDSCFTRFVNKPLITKYAQQPPADDTIPFVLTAYNNLVVKTCLNGTDTLLLKFDSGSTGLRLTHEAIAQKTRLLVAQKGVKEGTEKPNYRLMQPHNTLQIGRLRWDSLRINPVVLSGQGTDGRFGWDMFDGRIVEIDYDKKIFIVHNRLPKTNRQYAKLDMEYVGMLFCIAGTQKINRKTYKNRYLFDSGYQRSIMLDSVLMQEQDFPKDLKIIKKTIMKNGRGEAFPVITVNNEALTIGNHTLKNIPAQKLSGSNPANFKTHILGNDVLKRFNTMLDFQHYHIYLKPNGLINLPYSDAI